MALLANLIGQDIARVKVPKENWWMPVTAISLFDYKWDEIALIENISMNWSRPVTPKRHLNAGDAGVVLGLVPGPETPIRVTFGASAIYNDPDTGEQLLGPLRLFPDKKKFSKFRSLNDQHEYFNLGIICRNEDNPKMGGGFLLMRGLFDSYSLQVSIAGGGGTNEIPEGSSATFCTSRWVTQVELFG